MFQKNYFTFLWLVTLFLSVGLSTFAQTAPVRGRVDLKKADGTTDKVSKATIDVYRTDAKGKLPSAKTDKNGAFAFAGLTAGQTFALVVSAPGIKPEIYPNVRAGMENIVITVYEGDGRKWTEDEVRKALDSSQNAAASSTQGTTPTPEKPQATEEQKKAEAEYQKQVADITTKNEKIKNTTASVQKSLSEGIAAFNGKNYDLAISKFDEGINAEPDFAGTAPVLLNAKGAALKEKGFASYAQGAKATDAAIKASMFESAKKDWNAALNSLDKGLAILKTATAPDAEAQKNYDTSKRFLLSNLIEVHRLMSKSGVDRSKAAEAKVAYEQYFAVENDAALKSKNQLVLADILREAGDSENAILAYRKVLETSPDNPDALAGIGLSLFNSGVVADNKEHKQEGLNFMQKFADTAPETHPLKASVRDAVEYLKTQDKLTPQKTTKSTTTKKKS
jgi:tetratricopeptide (TPR) repeat protein